MPSSSSLQGQNIVAIVMAFSSPMELMSLLLFPEGSGLLCPCHGVFAPQESKRIELGWGLIAFITATGQFSGMHQHLCFLWDLALS